MNKKRIMVVIFAVVVAVTSFLMGFIVGKSEQKSSNMSSALTGSQTFYATIKENNNGSFLVEGLPVNDINFRGEFRFAVSDDTKLEWRYEDISVNELSIGNNISITFTGGIQETYPTVILDVTKIQLLNDEKN